MVEVTIAIPTYFGGKMVLNCVQSLMNNTSAKDIRILKNDIGWLKACNKIMSDALEEGNDLILLNDDTFITTDIVEEMSRYAYTSDEIGIVGGMSLMPNGDTVINYGIYIGPDGNTAHRYYGTRASELTESENQRAVEGSLMYIKWEVLNKIGFFDEGYGMGYREEVDYCFRAREAGYKVVSIPEAKYIHFTSQTNGPLGIKNDTFDYFMSKWGNKLKLGEI